MKLDNLLHGFIDYGNYFPWCNGFVGLKATGPDMIKTANNYYQKEQLPDARIISTMGLEKKDLTTLQSLKRCRNSCAAVYNRCHDWAAK